MTSSWVQMSLVVPVSSWTAALAFWSAAAHCSPVAAADGGRATLVPDAGDPWVLLLPAEDGPSVQVGLDPDPGVRRSPGGLVVGPAPAGRSTLARRPESVLDQVCLDIPGPQWDAEVEFWQRLTGRELEQGRRPEFAFLGTDDPAAGARILLQRLDSDDGPVRAHPDFAVLDRAAETERHLALGARPGQSFDDWTVMTAPDGTVYCLTDRDPVSGWVSRR